jgi:hypothetical protein
LLIEYSYSIKKTLFEAFYAVNSIINSAEYHIAPEQTADKPMMRETMHHCHIGVCNVFAPCLDFDE